MLQPRPHSERGVHYHDSMPYTQAIVSASFPWKRPPPPIQRDCERAAVRALGIQCYERRSGLPCKPGAR